MNRIQADMVVGLLITAVLIIGGALSWQADQQQRTFDQMGTMMGSSMGTINGPSPLWYVLGGFLVSAVIGGVYLTIRDDISSTRTKGEMMRATDSESAQSPAGPAKSDGPSIQSLCHRPAC